MDSRDLLEETSRKLEVVLPFSSVEQTMKLPKYRILSDELLRIART